MPRQKLNASHYALELLRCVIEEANHVIAKLRLVSMSRSSRDPASPAPIISTLGLPFAEQCH